MPLEIIGVGFGRTGTDSTRMALNRLGYPCYHMKEILEVHRDHLGFWSEVAAAPPGVQHDWERVFAQYRAAVDNPAAAVWRELVTAYPDAKVLLTLHPGGAEAWYRSTWETIYSGERRWQWRVLELLPPLKRLATMVRELVWKRFLGGSMPDRDRAIERYEAHTEEVRAEIPADRLLVFQVDQGWEPLCRFLGVQAPEEPFPRVNDRAEMRANLRRFDAVAYGLLALGLLLGLGCGYALYLLLF